VPVVASPGATTPTVAVTYDLAQRPLAARAGDCLRAGLGDEKHGSDLVNGTGVLVGDEHVAARRRPGAIPRG